MDSREHEEGIMVSVVKKADDVCISCGTTLYEDEFVNCDECHEALLGRLLVSPRWIKARAHMVEELRAEWQETHDRIRARRMAIVAV